jgi:hypothetical protein
MKIEINSEILKGGVIVLLLIFWHLKMFNHFEFIKGKNRVLGKNYMHFLLNPFGSGFYYMLVVCPLVFSSQKNRYLQRARLYSFLVWLSFTFAVVLELF